MWQFFAQPGKDLFLQRIALNLQVAEGRSHEHAKREVAVDDRLLHQYAAMVVARFAYLVHSFRRIVEPLSRSQLGFVLNQKRASNQDAVIEMEHQNSKPGIVAKVK